MDRLHRRHRHRRGAVHARRARAHAAHDLPPAGHPRQTRGGDARCQLTAPTLAAIAPRTRRRRSRTRSSSSTACSVRSAGCRGRRRAPRGRARHDHRAHRAERCGQDDAVQPAHRVRRAARAERGRFDGRSLHGMPAYRVARARDGAHVPADEGAGASMTVLDNMLLAAPHQSGERAFVSAACGRGASRSAQCERRAIELLERFNLADDARPVRRHAVGRAAQAARDGARADDRPEARHARRADGRREPGAWCSRCSITSGSCATEGLTVVFVEHDMDVVMGISDWVVCMAEGQVIAEGPPRVDRHATTRSSTRTSVRTAAHASSRRGAETRRGDAADRRAARGRGSRRGLPARRRHPARLQPHARRRARSSASSGRTAPGKSTLLKAAFGLVPVRSGTVTLAGEAITDRLAHELVDAASATSRSATTCSRR